MKTFPRCSSRVGLVVVLWALSGCGDSGAPITPTSLAISRGNQQMGCFLDTLADSLEVTLTGSDNKPFAGALVAWRVTSGAATLSRTLDTTDAAGKSRVQLSLGLLGPSAIIVTATVTGLPQASFSAAATYAAWALGETAAGELVPADCQYDGTLIDFYALRISGPETFTASLTAATFDAVVVLADTGSLVAFNDDSGDGSGGTGSFLKMIAAGGLYLVAVQTFSAGETGAYTLATAATPVAVDSCLFDVWVTRGITTDQGLKTTDCVDNSGPFYFDVYQILLLAGQTMTVTESSTAFDAELFLFIGNTLLASDDNGGGGTNAGLTWQAPPGQNEEIFIVAATAGIGETGTYTLTIAPPTATTATAASISPWEPIRPTGARGVRRSTENLLRSWHRVRGSHE